MLKQLIELKFLGDNFGRGAVWLYGLGTICLALLCWAVFLGMSSDVDNKLGLKAACAEVQPGMSAMELYDHFGGRGYRSNCLPAKGDDCGTFTDSDGAEHHFACTPDRCTMAWKRETWWCRVPLTPKTHRAWDVGALDAAAFD